MRLSDLESDLLWIINTVAATGGIPLAGEFLELTQ